jgi:Protein kinase domain/AAA ATPase domain
MVAQRSDDAQLGVAETALSLDRVAGRYRIEAELGRGGVGAVYRALDEGSGQTVALKLLTRTDARLAALFEREYETLAKLDHPRVISVYDYGIAENGQRYYTMELLGGQDLSALAPLPWLKVCSYLRDVCTTLSLLHAQGLVHRDVNPRNVRLDESGRAKLLDFGALSPFGVASELVGTPSCLAPEALRGQPLDARTDLFSLGAVMYWALTRKRPYPVNGLSDAEDAWRTLPAPPVHHVPVLPQALNELVLSMVSIDPLGRPASAADVIDRLNAIAQIDESYAAKESRVASWVLVGREPEQAMLEQLVARTLRGQGSVVCVDGAAGLGRTRMLAELSIHARLSGLSTVTIAGGAFQEDGAILHALLRGMSSVAPHETRRRLAQGPSALRALAAQVSGAQGDALVATERGPSIPARDPLELALTQQEAVAQLVCEVAGVKPLLLVVDDAHLLHPGSAFVLTLLAQAARARPLLLAMTRVLGAPAAPGVEQASYLGPTLALHPLSQPAVEQLVRSAFGEVPNRTRLSQWLLRNGRGVPGPMMDLLRQLTAHDVIRHVGGSWVLPAEIVNSAFMEQANTQFPQRVRSLNPLAHKLLQAFALHNAPLGEDVCFALAPEATPRAVLDAIGLLLREQVLSESREGYQLSQSTLRKPLLAELEQGARSERELQLARAIWSLSPSTFEALSENALTDLTSGQLVRGIACGLHFLRGGEHALAGKLLRFGAVELTVRGDRLADAAPDLEAAVETYRALGAHRNTYVALLPPLALAGTYLDHRLSYRYGEELMDTLAELSGLKWAAFLRRFIGGRVALFLSLAVAFVAFQLVPKRRAVADFRELLLGLMGIGSAVIAVSTVLQDHERAQRFLGLLAMLRFFPSKHPVRMVYEFQLAMTRLSAGDYQSARELSRRALAFVQSKDATSLPEQARGQLASGILMLLGQIDALRTDGSVAEDLLAMESLDTFTSRQCRTTTLVAFHGHRGERGPFQRHLEELDRLAADTGAVWRHDVQLPRLLWSSTAMCEDVMGLKRSVEQLDALADEVRSVGRLRDATHACYLAERGMPRDALTRYSALFEAIDLEAPSLRDVQYLGAYARILRKAGELTRAKRVCEAVLAKLSPEARAFTLLCFSLDLELSLVLSQLGQHAAAQEKIDALLGAQSHHDNPMLHGLAHGARAEIALAAGDKKTVEHHLARMGEWLRDTEHPTLFAQYQRMSDKLNALKSSVRHSRAPLFAKQDIEMILRSYVEPAKRYQKALELCLGEADAQRGYLYLMRDEELWLAAKNGLELPSSLCLGELREHVQAHRARLFETEHLTSAPVDNQNGAPRVAAGIARASGAEAREPSAELSMTTLSGPAEASALRVILLEHTASAFLLVPPSGVALGVVLMANETRALNPLASTFLTQIAESVAAIGEQALS